MVAPACGESEPTDSGLSTQERQQLEQHISELEAQVRELEAQVARQQEDAATSEKEKAEMTAQMKTLREDLAEARALLETQDWQGVLVRLEAAQAEIASLETRIAGLDGSMEFTAALSFGNEPFALDQQYTLSTGEKLTFTELRYWLSNIKLLKQDGTSVALPGSYYLMELLKEQYVEGGNQSGSTPQPMLPANRREQVNVAAVPAGVYTGIEFSIGVDPTHNDNLSLQAGELHMLRNMTTVTWMWFTSYIFTKTKGQYVAVDGTSNTFGWETGTNNDFRTTRQTFAAPVSVGAHKRLRVSLRADVAKLFTVLSPSTTPTINVGQADARATLSNGFRDMFTLVSVENPNRW
ncbi:MbnP family protein [Hyalangium rubrum]|uniref:MbnP family protein n=1 Tax=Hyalangium rubrum TaxID=3103134 RepID=A0ABU5HBY7_9BACT|nr:MbnP family protein [Hyalangium sp. s54d21]MDY7230337.1 MbnP family protein [Hyalangium sp. s54d21]